MSEFKIGDLVLNFNMFIDGGVFVDFFVLKGKNVVFYFYFKDDMLGCIIEVIDFSMLIVEFDVVNIVIIGVFKDIVVKYDKFKVKYEFKVMLGLDENGIVLEVYGVWVFKKFYGWEYMGIECVIFLINVDGQIVNIWCKVKVKGYVQVVFDVVYVF